MCTRRPCSLVLLLAVLATASTTARAEPGAGEEAATPLPEAAAAVLPEAEYTQAEDCIFKGRINRTDIISSDKIVFVMSDRQRYLVQLPMACPGLRRNAKVMYISDDMRLCSRDYLQTVYERGSTELQPGPRCHMGAFEPISEAQFDALTAEYRPADAPSVLDLILGRRR